MKRRDDSELVRIQRGELRRLQDADRDNRRLRAENKTLNNIIIELSAMVNKVMGNISGTMGEIRADREKYKHHEQPPEPAKKRPRAR